MYFMDWKINIVNIVIVPKLIDNFNLFSIKIPLSSFLVDIVKLILKFYNVYNNTKNIDWSIS